MGRRQIEQIDTVTGEVLQGCLMYVPYRPKIAENFFMAFQDGFMALAKDTELTGADRRVLDFLFSNTDFENYIHINQKIIADELGMKSQNVSRSMRRLIAKDIVIDGPAVGQVKTYRLNDRYGWRGRVTKLNEHRKDQLRIVDGGKDSGA